MIDAKHLHAYATYLVDSPRVHITWDNKRLALIDPSHPKGKPLLVDFMQASQQRRRQQVSSKSLLARAIGCKPNYRPDMLDATAGLANDSFEFACLGCQVTLLERSPLLAALIEDGLYRLAQHDTIYKALSFNFSCAFDYLKQTNHQHDVIYLDPMFDYPRKALNKKDMRFIAHLVGTDPDAHDLLAVCIQHARKRVVVKRPRHAPSLDNLKPDLQFQGKSIRYDVYLKL